MTLQLDLDITMSNLNTILIENKLILIINKTIRINVHNVQNKNNSFTINKNLFERSNICKFLQECFTWNREIN